MNIRSLSIFALINIVVNSIPLGLAEFGFFTNELEAHLCTSNPDQSLACRLNVNATFFDKQFNFEDDFSKLTPPHVSFFATEGIFNVKLNNSMMVPQVRFFFMVAEVTEVDIDLTYTAADTVIVIRCNSNGSYSKVSSNIFKSSVSSKDADRYIDHVTRRHPYVHTFWRLRIPKQDLESGHFTCHSIDNEDQAETIRIFTQTVANFGEFPFVPVRESTLRSDDSGHGFIVPCRTHYRLETAPDLLWRKHEENEFSLVTAEDTKSFTWDSSLGFKFTSSVRMWEMKTLACRLGPHEQVFLPTPSGFMNLYVVTVAENQIDCALSQRNGSNKHLLQSELNMIKKRYHHCVTDITCDLYWELGVLEDSKQVFEPAAAGQMMVRGIFSCSFEHIYGNQRVPETSYKTFFEGLDSKIYLLPGSYPNSSVIQITQVDRPFYKSRAELYYKFTCTIIDFIKTHPSVEFILRFKDNTEMFSQKNVTNQPQKSSSVAQFNALLHSNLTHIFCRTLTNEGKLISAESLLQIIDKSAPSIQNVETYKMTFQVGDLSDNHTLVCPITGAPPPNYQWIFHENSAKLVTGTNTRSLKFRQIHEDLTGRYVCHAWNDQGNNSFEFQVSVQPPDFLTTFSRTTIVWIGLGTIVGLIGLGATMVFARKYLRAQRQMRNLTTAEALEFLNGIPTTAEQSHGQQGDGSELALRFPFTKRIESNVLIVARDSILGKGQYGIVYRGFLHAQVVAVKAFKRAVTYDEFRAGLLEVKLMSFVGEHPNIVRFIGADVTNIEKRDLLIVMELSPFGSLEKHLRILKTLIPPTYANTTSVYSTDHERLLRKLFGFCKQIAFAMEHLESKYVIHGDLAARNVLVFDHDVVKVTDFGYSRHLYENNLYKPKKDRALPWRSASIELLRRMEFSTESDIWAFGVTAWEIFTFGNVPFASVRYSDEFVRSLEEGLRLEKPGALCESQYAFLIECWNVEKSRRPRFSVLKSFFSLEGF